MIRHSASRRLSHKSVVIHRQVTVIDFQGEDRQRGGVEPSAVFAPGFLDVPTSPFVTLLGLAFDEVIAHPRIPPFPTLAAKVVQGLCGVVVEVHVALGRVLGGDLCHAAPQGAVVFGPAQQHAAKQTHDRGATAIAGRLPVSVGSPPILLYTIKEIRSAIPHLARHVEIRQQGVSAVPTEGLTLYGNIGWLDIEYKDFIADLTGDGIATDNSGLDLVRAPEWDMSVGVTYEHDAGDMGVFSVGASFSYTDDMVLTTPNDVGFYRDQLDTIDAQINWRSADDRYRFSIWGKNLSDNVERLGGTPVATLFAFAAPTQPRQYGATLAVILGD